MYFNDNNLNSLAEEGKNYIDPVTEESLEYQNFSEGTEDVLPYDGEGIIDHAALLETYLVDMISQMNDEQRKVYYESDEFQNLLEAKVAGRRSIVRMTKQDDLTRRINLAAIQKAKEKGDADWESLRRNRVNERRLLERIYKKYGNAVRRDAMQAQKNLIRLTPRAFDMTKAIR